MNGDFPTPPVGQVLFEAILNEQQDRWNQGERPSIEEFLARYPALNEDVEATVDVIYQEFVIRRARGESPCAADYLRRFPLWSDALMRQFVVDQALRSVGGHSATSRASAGGEPQNGHGLSPATGGTDSTAPARSIDGFEILEELGRGGMGVVFKAFDRRLNRVVAIKTVSETTLTTPTQRRRFLAEAEVIARFRHSNIIPIYGIGEANGRPYFSLELAEGGNLAQRLSKGPLNVREAAQLVETLAEAVNSAHAAGIIHRDLKPSNVLLASDGTPKIGDFGLAKLMGDDSASTLSGEVLGTPSYMAPEQADGRSRDVGPAADIYALGAILYHTLTGRPPFLAASAIETMKLVVTTEAVPPRRQRPDVPRDFETITLKCLEKDPRRRYADAGALSADLRRLLEGRPIAARPVGPCGRLWRWRRRNPALATTAAALLLTFLAGSPALVGLWLQARADRSRAETDRSRAVIERDHAERSRDRAIGAVYALLRTENGDMLAEELRPYRRTMIEAGLREAQAMVQEFEGDPRAELQRLDAYQALARVQAEGTDLVGAAATTQKAIELAEKLHSQDLAAIRPRIALATNLHRASTFLPDGPSRLAAARRSNEILRGLPAGLAEADQRDSADLAAFNHYNIGHEHWIRGRQSEALANFVAAQAVYDQLLNRGNPNCKTRDFAGRNLLYLSRAFAADDRDHKLAAAKRAESIFQSLVREFPEQFDFAWQLSLAQDELGLLFTGTAQWPEAIKSFKQERRTLNDMASRHGRLVSRMATIQERIALVDINVLESYASDPIKYAVECRERNAEAYEICDKLKLVEPLSWNCRIAYAMTSFALADYQAEDGLSPDLELIRKAERLWDQLLRDSTTSNPMADAALVVVRRRLAEELANRGEREEAAHWDRHSLDTARGKSEMLYGLAIEYAQNAALTGKLPTKLTARQLDKRWRSFADGATTMLHQAAAEGFRDAARARKEQTFDAIRRDPSFIAILAALEFPAEPFAPP